MGQLAKSWIGIAFLSLVVIVPCVLLVDRVVSTVVIYPPHTTPQDFVVVWLYMFYSFIVFFLVYFGIDSIYSENPFELLAFLIANWLIFIHKILDYLTYSTYCQSVGYLPFCIAILAVFSALQPIILLSCWTIYRRMGWKFVREVGADLKLKKAFSYFQFNLSLLKLDALVSLIVCITAFLYSYVTPLGIALSIVGTIAEIAAKPLGYTASTRESPLLVYIFIAVCVAASGLLATLTIVYSLNFLLSTAIFLVISYAVVRIGVLVSILLVYNHFGSGLKEKVFQAPKKKPNQDSKSHSKPPEDGKPDVNSNIALRASAPNVPVLTPNTPSVRPTQIMDPQTVQPQSIQSPQSP